MSSTRSSARKAPATDAGRASSALVVCAHGVRGDPGIAAQHAASLRDRGLFAEVVACCLNGRPGLAETLARITAPRVYLVPHLMADGYTAGVIARRAAMAASVLPGELVLCPPVGTNARLAGLLASRATATCLAQGRLPRETALLVVAHGTLRAAGSGVAATAIVRRIADTCAFATVTAAFLDQPPSIAEALDQAGPSACVAVGLFADRGAHGESDVPRLLAAARRDAEYCGPIGLDATFADIIIEQVHSVRADGGAT